MSTWVRMRNASARVAGSVLGVTKSVSHCDAKRDTGIVYNTIQGGWWCRDGRRCTAFYCGNGKKKKDEKGNKGVKSFTDVQTSAA
jgi:hypothetical protein